jgi:hypothetical protein
MCVAICVDLISDEMCGIIGWGFHFVLVWGLEKVKVSGSLLNSLFGQGTSMVMFFNDGDRDGDCGVTAVPRQDRSANLQIFAWHN